MKYGGAWEDDALTIDDAVSTELALLWGDLCRAKHAAYNGHWSAECEHIAERIVALTRFVGATPWGAIDTGLLLDGTYQHIHHTADLDYPRIDWEQVCDTHRYSGRGVPS